SANSARPPSRPLPSGSDIAQDRRAFLSRNSGSHGHRRRHGIEAFARRHVDSDGCAARRGARRKGALMMGTRETRVDMSAQAVNARAASWLERQERGQWSARDQIECDAWLDESLAHQTAYWRLTEAWTRADRLRVLGSADDSMAEATLRWPRG